MQNQGGVKIKRLDDRINLLLQSGFSNHHRSIIFLVGPEGSSQLPLLFQIFKQKAYSVPQLAWCYDNINDFRTIKRRLQARLNQEANNNESTDFLELNKVRYVHYRDVNSLLGRTFDFLVLQDLGKTSPNMLAQTIETVRGGGIIIFLVTTVSDIEIMNSAWTGKHIEGEDVGYYGEAQAKPRFQRRLVRLLNSQDRILVLTDKLDVLSSNDSEDLSKDFSEGPKEGHKDGTIWRMDLKKIKIPEECGLDEHQVASLETLAALSATADQQRCFLDIITSLMRADMSYSKALQGQLEQNDQHKTNSNEEDNEHSYTSEISEEHSENSQKQAGDEETNQKVLKREEQQLRMLQRRNRKLYDQLIRLRDGDKTAFTGRGRLQATGSIQTSRQLQGRYFVTSGRGRGKSALLGLIAAACLSHGAAIILLVAPFVGNVQAVFEFAGKGLQALGYTEGVDYQVKTVKANAKTDSETSVTNKDVESLTLWAGGRRTLRFIPARYLDAAGVGNVFSQSSVVAGTSGAAALSSLADLILVDEAASFRVQGLRSLLESSSACVAASTVHGYEGSGQVLQLKLLRAMSSAQQLTRLSLSEPIRYAPGDRIESWLHQLLLLSDDQETEQKVNHSLNQAEIQLGTLNRLPAPKDCTLSMICRDTLFSAQPLTEAFLKQIWSLFTASHYRNQPDDLKLLSDGVRQRLFILHGPVAPGQLPIPLCAILVALEGGPRLYQANSADDNVVIGSGVSGDVRQGAGDLVPKILSSQHLSQAFAGLRGIRVVRIATLHTASDRGYGSRALELLYEFLQTPETSGPSKVAGSSQIPLLFRLPKAPLCASDWGIAQNEQEGLSGSVLRANYISTSYSLAGILHNFWVRAGFSTCDLGAQLNQDTGQHNCIMLKPITKMQCMAQILADFRFRLFTLAETFYRDIDIITFSKILLSLSDVQEGSKNQIEKRIISETQLKRLTSYYKRIVDYISVVDIIKLVSEIVFLENDSRTQQIKQNLAITQIQILAGVGVQRKSFAEVAKEVSIDVGQCQAIFLKTIGTINMVLIGTIDNK